MPASREPKVGRTFGFETDSTVLDRGELSISSLARLAADEREALRAELVAALPDAKYTLPLAALAFTAVRQ